MNPITYAVLTPSPTDESFEPIVVAMTDQHRPPMAIVLAADTIAMRVTPRFVAKPAPVSKRAYTLLKACRTVRFVSFTDTGEALGETVVPIETNES